MVAEQQDAALRADPVESLTVLVAFCIAELGPVAALEFVHLAVDLALVGAPDRPGADQKHFFDFNAIVDATRDQQVAVALRV